MNAEDIEKFILDNFEKTKADHPWKKDPDYTVFRHKDNKKWFALMFYAKKRQLIKLKPKDTLLNKHKDSEERVDILNVKVDPEMINDLTKIPGILPAYHMSRRHWISILVDGSVPEGTLAPLVDMSYEITNGRRYLERE